MKILLSGSSGFLGQALYRSLIQAGHPVTRLVRHPAAHELAQMRWDPARGQLPAEALADCEAVINLCGENVSGGLWTQSYRRRLLSSRLDPVRTLVKAILASPVRPRVFISASGINYYGASQDEVPFTEDSPPGDGFLAKICQEWEAAVAPLQAVGIRCCFIRLAPVLHPSGGLLGKMITIFNFGIGGRLGSGTQIMPWISLEDCLRVFLQALEDADCEGGINAVSPQILSNAGFTSALADALGRPAFCHAPAFLLRLLPGGMAEELLLINLRVRPASLIERQFIFKDPEIIPWLAKVLPAPNL